MRDNAPAGAGRLPPADSASARSPARRSGHASLTATTAVVLLTGGAGVAFATSHELHNRTVTPATTTSITPTTTSPTVTPTVTATVKPPAPTPATPARARPPHRQCRGRRTTSHGTPPPAVTTTPVTTLPTTTATTAPALPTAPAEYITVTVTVLPGKGSFTWQSGASGMVAQTFDSATHKPIPGSEQFRDE